MEFLNLELIFYVLLFLSGVILVSASIEDIKTREISNWKWLLIFLFGVISCGLKFWLRPASAAAYYTQRYTLVDKIDSFDYQSMFIYMISVFIIFFLQIVFFKGIGGGDIKLMLGLNSYIGFIPVIIGNKGFRSPFMLSLTYKAYSMFSNSLFSIKGFFWSILVISIILMIPLAFGCILSIPEFIIRKMKYKEIEKINQDNEEQGISRKKKQIKKSVAFVPYLSAGYIIFGLILYFGNFSTLI